MASALLMIFIALGLAYLLAELTKKLGIPRVVGQLIAGFILGISIIKTPLFTQANTQLFSFLANLGVVLLFYYAGLEINLTAFTHNIKKSILVSLFNTLPPIIIGYITMHYLLGFDRLASIVVAIALSVSAQAVSLDLLEELNLMETNLGRTIISMGAVDDTIELMMVTIILSLLHAALGELNPLQLFIDGSLFIVLIVLTRWFILPFALRFFDREKSTTARFTGALLILLFFTIIAEALNISALIGALIAGVLVRQTIYKEVNIPNWEQKNITSSLHIISFGFLIPLFFVWIGINTNIASMPQNVPMIFILTVLAFVGTIGGTLLGVLADGGSRKEGWLLGWGLNPKGDVELIIALLALQAGIISNPIFTSIVAMSLITTIISPIVFKHLIVRHAQPTTRKGAGKQNQQGL